MRVTAETITVEMIDQLEREQRAPHGDIGDTAYYASLSRQTIPGVRDPARRWRAAAWNARHGGTDG